jgi:hypothetical protein
VEPLRRAREMSLFGDSDEVRELPEVDVVILSIDAGDWFIAAIDRQTR